MAVGSAIRNSDGFPMNAFSPHAAPRPAVLAAIVLGLCFVLNLLAAGMNLSFSVFLLPLTEALSAERGTVSSIVSVTMLVSGLLAPVTGTMLERTGPQILYPVGLALFAAAYGLASFADSVYLLYGSLGLMGGVALACLGPVPHAALVNRWFYSRVGIAMGVVYSASGVGTLIISPSAAILIEEFDWRFTYRLFALLLAALIPVLLFLPWRAIRAGHPLFQEVSKATDTAAPPSSADSADETTRNPDRSSGWTLRRAMRTTPFWGMTAGFFFAGCSSIAILIHSVSFMIGTGIDPVYAATAFGLLGFLSPVGVIGFGALGDSIGRSRAVLLSYILGALAIFGLYLIKYHSAFFGIPLLVASFGLSMGARGPTVSSMASRIFTGPGFGGIYGAISMGGAFGAGTGAWLGGLLQDIFNTSDALLIFSSVTIVLSAAPFILIRGLRAQ